MALSGAPTQPDVATARPVDLRIVLDGASAAGKSSTARALGRTLGRPVVTPQEDATGRTVWFDWVDHVGGRVDGRPIRAQVVTVPGHLPDRRERLLATADAVLFVADTSHVGMPGSVRALGELRHILARGAGPHPQVLVQANKRDVPGPPLDDVRRALGLGPDDDLVETAAVDGLGVRHAFVLAVRLALRHRTAVDGAREADLVVDPAALLAHLAEAPAGPGDTAAPPAAPGPSVDTRPPPAPRPQPPRPAPAPVAAPPPPLPQPPAPPAPAAPFTPVAPPVPTAPPAPTGPPASAEVPGPPGAPVAERPSRWRHLFRRRER